MAWVVRVPLFVYHNSNRHILLHLMMSSTHYTTGDSSTSEQLTQLGQKEFMVLIVTLGILSVLCLTATLGGFRIFTVRKIFDYIVCCNYSKPLKLIILLPRWIEIW